MDGETFDDEYVVPKVKDEARLAEKVRELLENFGNAASVKKIRALYMDGGHGRVPVEQLRVLLPARPELFELTPRGWTIAPTAGGQSSRIPTLQAPVASHLSPELEKEVLEAVCSLLRERGGGPFRHSELHGWLPDALSARVTKNCLVSKILKRHPEAVEFGLGGWQLASSGSVHMAGTLNGESESAPAVALLPTASSFLSSAGDGHGSPMNGHSSSTTSSSSSSTPSVHSSVVMPSSNSNGVGEDEGVVQAVEEILQQSEGGAPMPGSTILRRLPAGVQQRYSKKMLRQTVLARHPKRFVSTPEGWVYVPPSMHVVQDDALDDARVLSAAADVLSRQQPLRPRQLWERLPNSLHIPRKTLNRILLRHPAQFDLVTGGWRLKPLKKVEPTPPQNFASPNFVNAASLAPSHSTNPAGPAPSLASPAANLAPSSTTNALPHSSPHVLSLGSPVLTLAASSAPSELPPPSIPSSLSPFMEDECYLPAALEPLEPLRGLLSGELLAALAGSVGSGPSIALDVLLQLGARPLIRSESTCNSVFRVLQAGDLRLGSASGDDAGEVRAGLHRVYVLDAASATLRFGRRLLPMPLVSALGPVLDVAADSGRPLLVFGPAASGKTTLIRALVALTAQRWPTGHALVYDPLRELAGGKARALLEPKLQLRAVLGHRPRMLVADGAALATALLSEAVVEAVASAGIAVLLSLNVANRALLNESATVRALKPYRPLLIECLAPGRILRPPSLL